MSQGSWRNHAAVVALVAAGIGAGWFVAAALEQLVHETDLRRDVPPCIEIGAPFHHRFRANCAEMLRTPRGAVPFHVNEDHLRDASRAKILAAPRRILVVGDSFVEGWWLREEATLPATLTAMFPRFYFINAGLRSTGPLQQAALLPALLSVYRPQGIIWVLNDTDVADDRLACALAEDPAVSVESMHFGTQDFDLPPAVRPLAEWLGDSQIGRRLRHHFYLPTWKRLAHGERGSRCSPCQGVDELLRLAARSGVPVLPIFIPAGTSVKGRPYEGEEPARAVLPGCLARHGLSMIGPEPPGSDELARHYWEGDFHLNPEGVVATVYRLAPQLSAWLARLANAPGSKRARSANGM